MDPVRFTNLGSLHETPVPYMHVFLYCMNVFCMAHARRRAKTYKIIILKNFIFRLERGPVALIHEFGKIAYVL